MNYHLKILSQLGNKTIDSSDKNNKETYYKHYGFNDLTLEIYDKIDRYLFNNYGCKYSLKLLVILLKKNPIEYLEDLSLKYKGENLSSIDELLEKYTDIYEKYSEDVEKQIITNSENLGLSYKLFNDLNECSSDLNEYLKTYNLSKSELQQEGGGNNNFLFKWTIFGNNYNPLTKDEIITKMDYEFKNNKKNYTESSLFRDDKTIDCESINSWFNKSKNKVCVIFQKI